MISPFLRMVYIFFGVPIIIIIIIITQKGHSSMFCIN